MEKNTYRDFLKDSIRQAIDFSLTAQNRGIPAPPVEKPCSPHDALTPLSPPGAWKNIKHVSIQDAIDKRKSVRGYLDTSITMDELSFLLWATQGMRSKVMDGHAFRTVPSAGCRHALETYLALFRVDGMEKGIYRYMPVKHSIVYLKTARNLESAVIDAALGQRFAGGSAATFLWTTIPARMEWRYSVASYKVIALDAGHLCQNLYLACSAIDCGTCAIAAYDQKKADQLLGVDGEEEFVIYMAPVGKILTA